jgi:hypothetical protein
MDNFHECVYVYIFITLCIYMNCNTCIYQCTLISDEGYTEHSGCPVIEGEKWITTVWMREGVSNKDPHTNYDPRGFRLDAEQTGALEPQEEETIQTYVSYSQEDETGGGGKVEVEATSTKGSSWFHKSIDKMKDGVSKMFASKSEL